VLAGVGSLGAGVIGVGVHLFVWVTFGWEPVVGRVGAAVFLLTIVPKRLPLRWEASFQTILAVHPLAGAGLMFSQAASDRLCH